MKQEFIVYPGALEEESLPIFQAHLRKESVKFSGALANGVVLRSEPFSLLYSTRRVRERDGSAPVAVEKRRWGKRE